MMSTNMLIIGYRNHTFLDMCNPKPVKYTGSSIWENNRWHYSFKGDPQTDVMNDPMYS